MVSPIFWLLSSKTTRLCTCWPSLTRAMSVAPAAAVYSSWSNLMSSASITSASAGTESLLPELSPPPHPASPRTPAATSEISKPPLLIFVMSDTLSTVGTGDTSAVEPRRPSPRRLARHPVPSEAMADQQQSDAAPSVLGPNAWLVEEMYEQFQADPSSVSENWRDFFEDYRSSRPQAPAARRTRGRADRRATAGTA